MHKIKNNRLADPYHFNADPDPAFHINVDPWACYDCFLVAVLRIWIRIRIHRIHMFLGQLDPDPLVRGMDSDPAPDPSIIMQK